MLLFHGVGPDFKFKNNTDYPVKILAWQEGSSMSVKILGTKTTDKVVETDTDIIETIDYKTVEKTDSSLSAGERETSQSGITGYKTVTYKIITENGQTTKVKANNSSYKSRDKIVLVGQQLHLNQAKPQLQALKQQKLQQLQKAQIQRLQRLLNKKLKPMQKCIGFFCVRVSEL